MAAWPRRGEASAPGGAMTFASPPSLAAQAASEKETIIGETPPLRSYRGTVSSLEPMRSPTTGEGCQGGDASAAGDPRNAVATMGTGGEALGFVANERESTPRVVGIQRTAHPRSAICGNRQCTGRVTVDESDASRDCPIERGWSRRPGLTRDDHLVPVRPSPRRRRASCIRIIGPVPARTTGSAHTAAALSACASAAMVRPREPTNGSVEE